MYCVIQKIKNKKPNKRGTPKEIIAHESTWAIDGTPGRKYYYTYSDERFERLVKYAYKISIHRSYREDGKVKKKQWVICTMGYYDILDFSPYDFISDKRVKSLVEEMGITEEEFWNMIYEKYDPLRESIEKEFKTTKEFKTKEEQNRITTLYLANKINFEETYGKDTYDYCYDVFGILRNEEYLEKLKVNYKSQREYQRSYQESNYNNYNYDFSSYFKSSKSNYTDEEKGYLKAIYKAAAMKLHPDIKKDNGEEMKFLNKLKDEWGI